MEEIGERDFGANAADWYLRDAQNVKDAQAVVLIGVKKNTGELQGALSVDLITVAPVSRKEAGVPLVMSTLA